MARLKAGFTIVELLIVIVVIAILAALVIVSYNGVRDNAVVSSLKSDLNQASKQMGLAALDNQNRFPTTIPSSFKPSKGNVLQLTTVTDSAKSWCMNAYGPNNIVVSLDSNSTFREYPCPGATIGSAVGGSVPLAPRSTNLITDLSAWRTSGNMSYDPTTKEMRCTYGAAGSATSPLMRVDGPNGGTFKYEAYATVASTTRPNSGTYVGSSYLAADGITAAYNTAPSPGPYSGNGYAPTLSSLSSWQPLTFTMTMGPSIIYATMTMYCDNGATQYTSDTRYRNPSFTVQ